MLSLPPKSKPSPQPDRIPVRRCYVDLLTDSGLVERRCFGEILQGKPGTVVFIDPEHPKLSPPQVDWGQPVYAAYVEFGGAAGRGKSAGTNNETLFGYPVFYQR